MRVGAFIPNPKRALCRTASQIGSGLAKLSQVACIVLLIGCSKRDDNGRYQLLMQHAAKPWMEQSEIILRIDSQTGKTWRMNYERIEIPQSARLFDQFDSYHVEGWVAVPEDFNDVQTAAMKRIPVK